MPSVAIFFLTLRFIVRLCAALYQAEGVNVPLLVMPTQLIAPTLRQYGAQVGKNVRFCSPLTIHNAALRPQPFYRNLTVGNDCYFGRDFFLDLQDRVLFEDKVTVSQRVMILTHTDVGESPLKDGPMPPSQAPVVLRYGAYVGAGAILLPGVELGDCAIVGAGSVVTRSVAARTVVAGVPARIIKVLEADQLATEVEVQQAGLPQ